MIIDDHRHHHQTGVSRKRFEQTAGTRLVVGYARLVIASIPLDHRHHHKDDYHGDDDDDHNHNHNHNQDDYDLLLFLTCFEF